jgi:glucose/arabinose dehydrogenase
LGARAGRVTRLLALLAAGTALLAPASAARPDALRLVRVASGLHSPVYVTGLRSEPGRLYVVEQAGRIVVLERGRVRAEPFLDIRSLVLSGGEQGLLSVAFDPGYAKNRRFYVDYTDRNGDTRVIQYRSDGTKAIPSSARQLLFVEQPYPNHNGGQLEFGPDGALWVGMGDGGSGGDPENRAQNPASQLGKLLRIDTASGRVSMAALGLRNPWRFSFDRKTHDLWIGDVGQGEWEEIDFLPRRLVGRTINYGWRVWEGRSRFERGQTPSSVGMLRFPIVVYSHNGGSCSVTGGYVYRGRAVPAARGRYFYGDFCSGIVWSVRQRGGKAVGLRRERFKVPGLSSFGEDASGELYLVSLNGSIFRLAR